MSSKNSLKLVVRELVDFNGLDAFFTIDIVLRFHPVPKSADMVIMFSADKKLNIKIQYVKLYCINMQLNK